MTCNSGLAKANPDWPILATVALEPNRWTGKRNPRFALSDLLEPIRRSGFTRLEAWQWHLSCLYLQDVRELRARADDLRLSFPYIGVYPSFLLEGPDRREEERLQADILDKAEILGTPSLKIMLGRGVRGSDASDEQIEETARRLGRWLESARERGIAMAVELHGNTLFDPVDAGIAFMQRYPELKFTICYQPYDFADTNKALQLADRFKGMISHIHLQAPNPNQRGTYDLLEEAAMDFRSLIPHLLRDNPHATMTLEFVKDCIQDAPGFDVERVLANAVKDAEFVARLLADRKNMPAAS